MKKRVCILLAVIVSLCCLVCLASTAAGLWSAYQYGGGFPLVQLFMTVVTGLCAWTIWRDVRGQ